MVALTLLNENLNNEGTLVNDSALMFETHIFLYKVTFPGGVNKYQIQRLQKDVSDYITIGLGLTLDDATHAMPDYGPFLPYEA